MIKNLCAFNNESELFRRWIHKENCCFIDVQLIALRDRLTNNLSAKGGMLIMTCEVFFFSSSFSFRFFPFVLCSWFSASREKRKKNSNVDDSTKLSDSYGSSYFVDIEISSRFMELL